MDEWQAVMRQWLAFLQAGRSWQRQAANMAARSDLAAGGLGSLLREAASGQRPSAQEIVLLLGAGRLAPGVGAKQGVEQRFNSLPRPGRKPLFRHLKSICFLPKILFQKGWVKEQNLIWQKLK